MQTAESQRRQVPRAAWLINFDDDDEGLSTRTQSSKNFLVRDALLVKCLRTSEINFHHCLRHQQGVGACSTRTNDAAITGCLPSIFRKYHCSDTFPILY